MRTIHLLLLVALTAVAESRGRAKREYLARYKRRWVLSTIQIIEEDKGPFPKKISTMYNDKTDNKDNHIFEISGTGVDEPPLKVFSINATSGDVYAWKKVDRETHDFFHIKFDILDKFTRDKIDKELAFDVEVEDINDNPPKFDPEKAIGRVKENAQEGYTGVELFTFDPDKANTSNSKVTVTKLRQTPAGPDIYLESNGIVTRIKFRGCFDFDKQKKYDILVHARDHGTPSLSSTTVATIIVEDSNTHPPKFKERQYSATVNESVLVNDFLRVQVEDKDTPNTPGSRAVYYFVKGNEGGNYKIETDPKTNEGILSIIKGKDYETTTVTNLTIAVRNEEDLFACKDFVKGGRVEPSPDDTVQITVKVIDVNDPPVFDKSPIHLFSKEEEPPGKVLFTASVKDEDSKNARFVVLDDPAGWFQIDEKSGKLSTAKKTDRESPHVDKNGTYKAIIGAIDDGEPPATGTATVILHLGDINDNLPHLATNGVVLCGNKANKVLVPIEDKDAPPFGGPFVTSLGGDVEVEKKKWKIEPSVGMEAGIVSLTSLAYGNYSVPLVIEDQQGTAAKDTLEVMVCDCGKLDVCRPKDPPKTSLGAPAIGLIFLGILCFLLLLLLLKCQCGKEFKHIPIKEEEGSQTLIKYNQEGGGAECKSEPTLLRSPTTTVTDGVKMGTMQMKQSAPVYDDMEPYNTAFTRNYSQNMNSMGTYQGRDTMRSIDGNAAYSTWTTRQNTYHGSSSKYKRSTSVRSNQHIADGIDRRLFVMNGELANHPAHEPRVYAYEGQGSRSQSLDKLSVGKQDDDLGFLNNLGPKFKTLGGICSDSIKGKNVKL